MNLDWLIIGGGIHGVHIAARLLGEADVDPERLRILDPGDHLLSRWRACTATTGMSYLRSPVVHNLDLGPWSLERFAGQRRHRGSGLFMAPYNRPALGLFNSHCDLVLERFGLPDLHIQGRAHSCMVNDDGAVVQLGDGRELVAKNLVLAMGAGERPEWPAWAPHDSARVSHIFEPGFDGWPASSERVVVVGGGISACQVALRLVDEGHTVHLVSRHALRKHQFDSDSGWLGPKHMSGFSREKDLGRRRALIKEARHRGSVPPDVQRALRGAIANERLGWLQGEVMELTEGDDKLTLLLNTNDSLAADRVLLATGFAAHRPGGPMIDGLIASADLPCAQCGYPVVDSALRWHRCVYVSGPLAELELGPVSRNIAGARRAADRVVASVVKQDAAARKAS